MSQRTVFSCDICKREKPYVQVIDIRCTDGPVRVDLCDACYTERFGTPGSHDPSKQELLQQRFAEMIRRTAFA